MARAIEGPRARVRQSAPATRWEKGISNHIAYALLVYTGLQIFLVMGAIKTKGMSILPYFILVLLVGLIIPWCRRFERRWAVLAHSELSESSLAVRYRTDRLAIWLLAIGIPFALVLLFSLPRLLAG
ncbi:MAG: hypothetical protein R3E02_12195 [Blastomonas sp.]